VRKNEAGSVASFRIRDVKAARRQNRESVATGPEFENMTVLRLASQVASAPGYVL